MAPARPFSIRSSQPIQSCAQNTPSRPVRLIEPERSVAWWMGISQTLDVMTPVPKGNIERLRLSVRVDLMAVHADDRRQGLLHHPPVASVLAQAASMSLLISSRNPSLIPNDHVTHVVNMTTGRPSRTIKSILPLLLPAPSKRRANQAPAHNGSPLTPPNNIVTPIAPVPPPAIRLTTSSPTNAIGQRICLQCGLPGRYKDNKCVEKWGPGPEGPGTVCDRCRNKMKRVERRGTTDANVALATPVKLDCTVRKSFLSVRLLGRRDRRSRKSFRARYLAWLLCFYRTTNTVVGLQRTLREIGTVTLSPRLRSLLVFCQTKATAEAMVKASATRFYHSELPDEETKKALDSFRAGAGSFRVLYTTSALSAGLDIRDIRVVVHLRKPNNMLDYGQEFGLGCRDGKPGWTFIFHDPKHKPFTSRTGQDHTGVSEITSWLSTPSIYDPSLAMLPAPECRSLTHSQPSLHPQPASHLDPHWQHPLCALSYLSYLRPQHVALPMPLPVPPQQPLQPFGLNTKNDGIRPDVAARPESGHLLSDPIAPSKTLQAIVSSLAADQRQHMKQQMLSFKNFFPGLQCAVYWVVGTLRSLSAT
ncbi:hypothetical protein F4604DRAFT_1687127 [Suillus subluteus]|nr:hypothetical protein F4604DRAFT_1687127 [Suillus subluteus]